jgi:hypothetical protein
VAFEHAGRVAPPGDREGGGEAGHAAADDQDVDGFHRLTGIEDRGARRHSPVQAR